MKAYLLLGLLLMAAFGMSGVQAVGDSAASPEDEPNFEPKVTKDPTNEKIEIIEFACKLK